MTGQYRDWAAVVTVLRGEGHLDVERWLDVPPVHTRLADVCDKASKARARQVPDPNATAGMSDESAIWSLFTPSRAVLGGYPPPRPGRL